MDLKNINKYYSQFAIIVLNTLLLFVVLNVVAAYWLKSNTKDPAKTQKLYSSDFVTSPKEYFRDLENPNNLLYKVYPGHNKESILQVLRGQLRITDHPTLGFMVKPGKTAAYHVGQEGARFDPFVQEMIIDSLLHAGKAVWCLGGSTTYGHCQPAHETLPFHLNDLTPKVHYVNLGVPGYYQNVEVDKLILMLKKGYRPSQVIFLDGNNDFLNQLFMNFHPAESPTRTNQSYPQLANHSHLQKLRQRLNLSALPILKLVQSWVKTKKKSIQRPGLPFENLNDPEALYFASPSRYIRSVKDISCDSLALYFPQKVLEMYRTNQQFVDKLATAYGFEYDFFFQPLGFLHEDNPFITDFEQYQEAWDCYDVLRNTQQLIRDSIAAGVLPHFHDLSQADEGCDNCYIDLVHYSAPFNQKLAKMMLQKMDRPEEVGN